MEKCKPTQKQDRNPLSFTPSKHGQYTTLLEGMELLEPTLVRLPNGVQAVKLPENGITGLFTVSPPEEPQTGMVVVHVKRVRKRRPTWDEQGKIPPWDNHDNKTGSAARR